MPSIQFDFSVVGVGAVQNALAGIERQAARVNQQAARARTGGIGPWSAGNRPLGRTEKLALQVAKDQERAAKRLADAQIKEARRAANEQIRQAQRVADASAREEQRRRQSLGRNVTRGVRSVGNFAAGTLALGGGLALASAIGREKDFDKALRLFVNSAGGQLGMGPQAAYGNVRGKAFNVGQQYGIPAQEALRGAAQFGEISGQYGVGVDLMQDFARVAAATGTDMGDVASTVGNAMMVLEQRGVKGAAAVEQINLILEGLVGQGRAGAIEFKDLADQMAKVVGAASQMPGGTATDNILQLSAATQWARKVGGAPNAEQATTAIFQLVSSMQKPVFNKKLGEMEIDGMKGISPFVYQMIDGKKTAMGMRSPIDVLNDIFVATGGDKSKLGSLFNERARKAADPFFTIASERAVSKKIPLPQAWKEMMEEFQKMAGARVSRGQLEGEAQFSAAGFGARWTKFLEEFSERLGPQLVSMLESLLPAFESLIPAVEMAADVFEELMSFLASVIPGFDKESIDKRRQERELARLQKISPDRLTPDQAKRMAELQGVLAPTQTAAAELERNKLKPKGAAVMGALGYMMGGPVGALGMGALGRGIADVEGAIDPTGHGSAFEDRQLDKRLALYDKDPAAKRARLAELGMEAGELQGGGMAAVIDTMMQTMENYPDAAAELQKAAGALKAAGDKLQSMDLNRGAAPNQSPVNPRSPWQ